MAHFKEWREEVLSLVAKRLDGIKGVLDLSDKAENMLVKIFNRYETCEYAANYLLAIHVIYK